MSYTQEKRGRTITGFKFTVRTKDKPKDAITHQRDPHTIDAFTGQTDTESKKYTVLAVKRAVRRSN